MALQIITTNKLWILALTLLYLSLFWNYIGKAEEDVPQTGVTGAEEEYVPQKDVTGAAGASGAAGATGATATGTWDDPAQVVAKALLCFHDKYIYSSCEESHRLKETGNMDVPPEKADDYCEGPCLTETNLVLGCIDNIFSHFLFYNKATIQDVRETIQAACGYGPERGNFNVAEHIKTDENNAWRLEKLCNKYP
ncbi:Glycine-rich protein family [Quillaja saponaria]|uniref:Glycine-rich protein family n=1 Tax=Quillaja saponaria TaxID=32244 RepID=A0AAD7QF21_QUISA|nr:Glycine-rich protein family [Quillaja saponaria]